MLPSPRALTPVRVIGRRLVVGLAFAAAMAGQFTPERLLAQQAGSPPSATQPAQPPSPAPQGPGPALGTGAGAGDPFAGQPRIRALIVSGGCCHDYTGQDKLVMEIIRKVLPVDWTVVYQGGTSRESKIPLYAEANWIKGFDIVFHNECFGFVDDVEYVN